MNDAEYRAYPATNFSLLKHLATSPRHFLRRKEVGNRRSPSMNQGILNHMLLLEPARYHEEVAVYAGIRRGKAWEEFQSANEGKFIVKAAEEQLALNMINELATNDEAWQYFHDGHAEVPILWTHPSGEQCKSKLDYVHYRPSDPTVVDYKQMAGGVKPHQFANRAERYKYHLAAAFYSDAFEHSCGLRPRFVFVCQTPEFPYDSACYEMDEEWVQDGRDEIARLIELKRTLEASGNWEHMNGGKTLKVSRPQWAQEKGIMSKIKRSK